MAYKTILVHLKLGAANDTLLKITGELAQRFRSRIIGVVVSQPLPELYPAMQTAYGNGLTGEDISDTDRKVTDRRIHEAEQEFRTALRGYDLEWRSTVTKNSRSEYVARQCRSADLLITSPVYDGRFVDQSQKLSIGDIVLHAGRPVLLIPPDTEHLDLDCAVVGWKDTREARRAAADSLPLLAFAKRVVVAEITARQDIADSKRHVEEVVGWLRAHDVAAEARIESYKGVESGQLDFIARECGAGLFVAGAYGHTRFREWVIGGVTMDLLLHPKRPTLVSH